nr:hypothetical protein [Tanacetum cinerariifolium]
GEEDDGDEDKNGDERDDDDQDQDVAKHDDKNDTEESRNVDEEGESDKEDVNKETKDEESFDPIPQTPESSEDKGDSEDDQGLRIKTESNEESDEEETREEEEESFDPIPRTPEDSEDDGNGEEDQGLRVSEEQRLIEEEEANELYRYIDINQGRGLQSSADIQDSHVTLTPVNPDGQQESSSVSSQFVSSMLNPKSDAATITTINHAPIPPTIIPSEVLQNLPTFDSVFRFEDRLKSLEVNFSEFIQTNQFVEAISNIPVAADLLEMELKKILIEKMEGNKSIQRSDEQRNLYNALERPSDGSDRGSKRRRKGGEPESALAPLEPATRSAGSTQIWISKLVKQADSRSSFNEILDTPIDFSNFIINRLGVDTLTPELLGRPTYELMRGSCNSLTELEYHLEEVYKATTDQLDWVNPEGQQYPHNLLQPLQLIPDNRGRRVIPFAHFINNDLEYLRGGASSQKYTTSVTKTMAANYGHIKWIEGLVTRTMWIQEPINYDKHALWGVSHWGRKCQQFYGFDVNQESALDVYSKRRIIAVTDLKIVEWHNYMHLDKISIRRDDDKIYKFKECDFKRLPLQDIKDMLLVLVQGKLSNLTVEERFAFNVSLRMFTRSIVIQRRVEDLQLGV